MSKTCTVRLSYYVTVEMGNRLPSWDRIKCQLWQDLSFLPVPILYERFEIEDMYEGAGHVNRTPCRTTGCRIVASTGKCRHNLKLQRRV